MTEEQSYSSYEERILAAALKLAESADDPSASSDAVSEIVHCARGILRRVPEPDEAREARRRASTLSDIPTVGESHVEYDEGEGGKRC